MNLITFRDSIYMEVDKDSAIEYYRNDYNVYVRPLYEPIYDIEEIHSTAEDLYVLVGEEDELRSDYDELVERNNYSYSFEEYIANMMEL